MSYSQTVVAAVSLIVLLQQAPALTCPQGWHLERTRGGVRFTRTSQLTLSAFATFAESRELALKGSFMQAALADPLGTPIFLNNHGTQFWIEAAHNADVTTNLLISSNAREHYPVFYLEFVPAFETTILPEISNTLNTWLATARSIDRSAAASGAPSSKRDFERLPPLRELVKYVVIDPERGMLRSVALTSDSKLQRPGSFRFRSGSLRLPILPNVGEWTLILHQDASFTIEQSGKALIKGKCVPRGLGYELLDLKGGSTGLMLHFHHPQFSDGNVNLNGLILVRDN